ncbi:MAG: hypothetical protein WCT08_06590 [Patescibacteria group bacterium]|jgi:hypothetical protein
MTQFEGREISTISDEMPGRPWDREKFFADWESQIRQTNGLYGEDDIRIAKEIVISGYYETYEELLKILDEENLPNEDKSKLISRLNLAMVNVLEFGQRRGQDIASSLKDRKLWPDEKNSNLFNGIIDHLILEVNAANDKFNTALEKFEEEKRIKGK